MSKKVTKTIDELYISRFEKPEHAAEFAHIKCEEFKKLGWVVEFVSISRGGVNDTLPWILNVRGEKHVEFEVPE